MKQVLKAIAVVIIGSIFIPTIFMLIVAYFEWLDKLLF